MEKKRYYMIVDGADAADLYIFGDITAYGHWGDDDPNRSAYDIVTELNNVKANKINVHINSYGGDVSEGLAIYNTLKNSAKEVTTYCDGFACSAASVVFMAGAKRVMSKESLLMIHNAWVVTMGNSDELRKQADDLEKVTQASVEAYKSVATISENEIKQMMKDETWISADDALSYGFATEISDADDGDEPQQSAMKKIHEDLTSKADRYVSADKIAHGSLELTEDEISKLIVKSIQTHEKMVKEKESSNTNGWGKYWR